MSDKQKNNIVFKQYKVFEDELIRNIPNEKRASIVSNLTNNYLRGSNKLGFKKRKRAKAVKTAKKRLLASQILNPENKNGINNLSNKRSKLKKIKQVTGLGNSRTNLEKAINQTKNKK